MTWLFVSFFFREVQVLTSTKDDSYPPRFKQNWVPVTMSGQVADLVESTQLLWSMLRDSEQVTFNKSIYSIVIW